MFTGHFIGQPLGTKCIIKAGVAGGPELDQIRSTWMFPVVIRSSDMERSPDFQRELMSRATATSY